VLNPRASLSFIVVVGLLCASSLRAQTPVPTNATPEEITLRNFLSSKPGFDPYLFDGTAFPKFVFQQPASAAAFLGECKTNITFFNAQRKRVSEASRPGMYGAVVELTPSSGHTIRRIFTLYRIKEDHLRTDSLHEIAQSFGIPYRHVFAQRELIQTTFTNRSGVELGRDARVARLLAGLSQSARSKVPRKNEDAFAQERQWWVELKADLFHIPKAQSLDAPRRLHSPAATVVRNGSLAEAGMKPDAAAKIDAALQGWAADSDQAFAVCIVRHGVIVLHKAYGLRNGSPMTLTTKSWMASVTKTMSATLMMMLVDRGLVDLDAPIERYLPELRSVHAAQPITIRHLYTHTSGLDKWPAWSDESPDVADQVADCYPFVLPGAAWVYNGQGYTLGGKIIETISGEAIPFFYLNHLLGPLGCANTDVIATHADAMTVPLDMARFGQMLLNRGSYGQWQFFRPEIFEMMLPRKLTNVLGPAATKTFGIGLDGVPGSGRFGHGTASAAAFHIDANEDLVVIMTRNAIGTNYDKYNGKFWQAIKEGMVKSDPTKDSGR